jgi:protein-disulfide isomerase
VGLDFAPVAVQDSRMLRIPLLAALALAALAACDKPTPSAREAAPGDAEARLARLEKRVDKIVEILEQALGAPRPDPSTVYSVAIDPLDPVEGPADAKVTIVEGYEFACPYCLQAYPIVEALRREYPDDVRVITKYLVVHPEAIPSGLAVCAANQQGKYPEMKRLIWEKAWTPEGRPIMEQLEPPAMVAFAQELGLDLARFEADMSGQACAGWLEHNEQVLRAVGQNGTPGFFVNGRSLGGLVPLPAMKQIVGEELRKADEAIAGGIPQKDLYQVAVVDQGERKVKGWFDVE